MKRWTMWLLLAALVLPPAVRAEDFKETQKKVRAWRDAQEWSLYGSYSGVVFESELYEDYLDKDYLPMVRLGWGWYPLPNLAVESRAGLVYEENQALGSVTGEESAEEYKLWIAPVQVDLRYRFKFTENQLVVPSAWAGGDWWYFKVDPDESDNVEGDKSGWHWGADLAFLLDPLDPLAAHRMQRNWRVNNTYLCLGYERAEMESGGLDFSGDLYTVSLRFDAGPPPLAR